jgi:hypothetical protein
VIDEQEVLEQATLALGAPKTAMLPHTSPTLDDGPGLTRVALLSPRSGPLHTCTASC